MLLLVIIRRRKEHKLSPSSTPAPTPADTNNQTTYHNPAYATIDTTTMSQNPVFSDFSFAEKSIVLGPQPLNLIDNHANQDAPSVHHGQNTPRVVYGFGNTSNHESTTETDGSIPSHKHNYKGSSTEYGLGVISKPEYVPVDQGSSTEYGLGVISKPEYVPVDQGSSTEYGLGVISRGQSSPLYAIPSKAKQDDERDLSSYHDYVKVEVGTKMPPAEQLTYDLIPEQNNS
jgi:hypothetical protein